MQFIIKCYYVSVVKENILFYSILVYSTLFYTWLGPPTICLREAGEGWPLLTVETELNGDSKSTNEKDRAGTRDFCSALAAL